MCWIFTKSSNVFFICQLKKFLNYLFFLVFCNADIIYFLICNFLWCFLTFLKPNRASFSEINYLDKLQKSCLLRLCAIFYNNITETWCRETSFERQQCFTTKYTAEKTLILWKMQLFIFLWRTLRSVNLLTLIHTRDIEERQRIYRNNQANALV